jgi:hypothetical protein
MINIIKAFFLLTTLYLPVVVSIMTGSSMWLFMWFFVIFVSVFDNDKDNGSNND